MTLQSDIQEIKNYGARASTPQNHYTASLQPQMTGVIERQQCNDLLNDREDSDHILTCSSWDWELTWPCVNCASLFGHSHCSVWSPGPHGPLPRWNDGRRLSIRQRTKPNEEVKSASAVNVSFFFLNNNFELIISWNCNMDSWENFGFILCLINMQSSLYFKEQTQHKQNTEFLSIWIYLPH